MAVTTSAEKILYGKSVNFLENFTSTYVPYVTKLLEYGPKNRLDIYKFSAAYFEDKLKERQRMFEYESSKEFCRKNNPNETLELQEKSEKPSLETIPPEADFIYDSIVEIYPKDKNFKNEENARIGNQHSSKPKEAKSMGDNSKSALIQQIQILISAIETLHLDFSHVLQDMIHREINTEESDGALPPHMIHREKNTEERDDALSPHMIHCEINTEYSDDELPPDFQFKKTTEIDEKFHKTTNAKEDAVDGTELRKLSKDKKGEFDKTTECICSILSTAAKLKNSDEQSNIAKCPRCTGASMAQYIINIVKSARELINSIKRTIELKGLNCTGAFNDQDSHSFRIISTALQDSPYSIAGLEYEESRPKAYESKPQLPNEKVSVSKERKMRDEALVICSQKEDSNLLSRHHVCTKNNPNETLELEEKSEKSSLETIPPEADFIYDSVVEIYPKDKNFKNEENARIGNEHSFKPKEAKIMGDNSTSALIQQIQILNSAIETLHLDFSHVLQDMIHREINTEESDDALPPHMIHHEINSEESDDELPPDFQFKKTTEIDKKFHKPTNTKKDAVDGTELRKLSRHHEDNKIFSSQKEITLKGISEEDEITELSTTEQSSIEQTGRIFDFGPFRLGPQKLDDIPKAPGTVENFHRECDVSSTTETEPISNTSSLELTSEKSSSAGLQPNGTENNLEAANKVKDNKRADGSIMIKCDTWIRDDWISPKLLDSKIETSYQENSIMTDVPTVPTNLSCHFKQRNI